MSLSPSICSRRANWYRWSTYFSSWLLADRSLGLSQAEKKITVDKDDEIFKNDNSLFTQNLTVLSENNCHFVNLLRFQ